MSEYSWEEWSQPAEVMVECTLNDTGNKFVQMRMITNGHPEEHRAICFVVNSEDVPVIQHSQDLACILQRVLAEFGNFCCENCINEEEMLRDHPELVEAINQADSLLKKVRGT